MFACMATAQIGTNFSYAADSGDIQSCFEGCSEQFRAESKKCNGRLGIGTEFLDKEICDACGGNWEDGILGGCTVVSDPLWINAKNCFRRKCHERANRNYRSCAKACTNQRSIVSNPGVTD